MELYNSMVADLEESLTKLNRRNRNSLWLRELITPDADGVIKADCSDLIDMAIMPIMQGLQQKSTLADVACTIGRKIRQKFKYKQDTLCSLFGGLLILESFANVDFLGTKRTFGRGKKKQKHPPYHIYVRDWGAYEMFLENIDVDKLEEAPLKEPAANWVGGFHQDGKTLIRHGNITALKKINGEDHSVVLHALNKLQNTGYRVNEAVFQVYLKCMKLESGTPFKYEKETNIEAQKSMKIEADGIRELATKNLHNSFYHRYSCDFRGRIYPGTAYLNEQSSDNAKGLLIYDNEVEFGENGAYYLAVHTANCIGEDKLPLDDRVRFVNENMDVIIGWASDPMVHTDWMQTDKPWSTLAACMEWKKYDEWVNSGGDSKEFKSALPIFIDGSNNGIQHLTALSLDETVAHLVSLNETKPGEVPGDVYMFIADKVWERLEVTDGELEEEERAEMQRLIDEVREIKLRYEAAWKNRKVRDQVYKELVEWRTNNRELIKKLWATFWLRVEDKSTRRKCVKRPVMTLGYGVTLAGVREQLFDDTKELNEDLRYKEKMWVTPMGDLVFNTCYEELPGPAGMLNLFKDLANRANAKNEFLGWSVPITNFPVLQAYEEPTKVQVNANFQGQRIQLTVQKYEDMRLSKKDQLSGAAPNVVHSFDAAHLTLVVNACDFPVTMIHDSFGCHIGNMDKMFDIVRQQFIEFYVHDPLKQLLEQLESMDLMPNRGTLDLYDVMLSDFAFC